MTGHQAARSSMIAVTKDYVGPRAASCGRWSTSTCTSTRASWSAWWARRGAASRRCCPSPPASRRPPTAAVLVDGRHVTGPGPDRGLVFQSYSLYPWRTVAENVAFGLELKGLAEAEIARPGRPSTWTSWA